MSIASVVYVCGYQYLTIVRGVTRAAESGLECETTLVILCFTARVGMASYLTPSRSIYLTMACVLITFPGLHDEMADTMHEVDEAKSVLFEPSLTGFHFWKLDQRILVRIWNSRGGKVTG